MHTYSCWQDTWRLHIIPLLIHTLLALIPTRERRMLGYYARSRWAD